MKYSVDRIEEQIVVLVDSEGNELCKGIDSFDTPPCEGMVFEVKKSNGLVLNEQQTEKARDEAIQLLENILKKQKKQ